MLRKFIILSCALFVVQVTALSLKVTHAQTANCTPDHFFKTVADGKLTAHFYNYAPYAELGADGVANGIDIDILKIIAEENCLEFVFAVADPAATIQAVVTGKADISVGGWNRTNERAEMVGISEPVNLAPMGIWSKDGINTVAGMVGRKVGTVSGYMWVSEVRKMFGNDLNLYPSRVALHQDLYAGRIDIALDGYIAGKHAQGQGAFQDLKIELVQEPDERIQASVAPPQTGILYTKDNEILGKAINTVIVRLKEEGKIAEILTAHGLDADLADTGQARLVLVK